MKEEWIKVSKIIETDNLANEITNNIIKNWEELLNSYNIKYKFDIEESTRYFQGHRGQYLDKVYIMYLYTVKEDIQRAKQIISDFENAKSEIPDELKEVEEDDTKIKPIKVFNYFFSILVILLIILEIGIMIITKDDINNKGIYILMAVIIISELYSIYYINKRKRKKNNE